MHYSDVKDSEAGMYIAEWYESCPNCVYKRLISRTTDSGQVLFASVAPTDRHDDIEHLIDLGRKHRNSSIGDLLRAIVESAPYICLIADDDRRYAGVNHAATDAIALAREQIIGRRIDDFFAIAPDISVACAWQAFVNADDQFGTCELLSTGAKFAYRARANFLPGLHISLLRPVTYSARPARARPKKANKR